MTIVLFVVMLVFLTVAAFRAVKASENTKTIHDFYSFGEELDPSTVRRAFQATNISFTTSFVSLYLFGFVQGWFTFATPIAFCLGIVVYAKWILPKQINALASGKKYPQLLAEAIHLPRARNPAALFVIFSLWMFAFAEVQGLHLFIRELFRDSPGLVLAVPIILVCSIAFYVSRNGYRATTSNDRFQMRCIFVGAWAVVALACILLWQKGISNAISAINLKGNPFGSRVGASMFLIETCFGFIFSQLLYYDNWQRLGFWVQSRIEADLPPAHSSEQKAAFLGELSKVISTEYTRGTVPMFLVFCAPIFLSFATLADGTAAGDVGTLSNFFRHSWNSIPVLGPVLVIAAFTFMLSALISTAESYFIAISNCLLEDVLGVNTSRCAAEFSDRKLEAAQILTAVVAVSLVPFLLIRPNFDTLFIYLFYSANGFVGPLIFITLGKTFRLWGLLASASFGFLYPAIPIALPSYANLAPYPGIVTVAASIIIVFISKTISKR